MQSNSLCIVVLTDSLYLPGTLRLIESWKTRNPELPVIALSRDSEVLTHPSLIAQCEQRHRIDKSEYDGIRPYKKSRSKRHAETFYKFEAFQDYGYERNIFLDSDLLCLRPAPLLLQASQHQLLAAIDTGFRKTRGYKGHATEINTGVLSIHKSIQGNASVEQLKTIARENPGRSGYNAGDQGIINKWIQSQKIDLGLLPTEYNLIKKDYSDTTELETCRLLHFCDRKPWFAPRDAPSGLEALWTGNTARHKPAD
ncbi:glycosyltransferase [Pelagicoccus mobilis]|uniref:Glycosyl transferase family 8 n=1 Tax=Pelagicoccus mobilis TaxID=415221 RepID=A0A934S4V8_9BACT|nr:glycosyltransferase [Pelagicoccus mobilis]MBK1879414.1 hypothetical protein [Pelagicoccus mobilis]